MIAAGRLRDEVVIESPPTSLDTNGHPSGSWVTVQACRAEVVERDGSEDLFGAVPVGEISHVVTIRAGATVTAQMRVSWDGVYLDIRRVLRDVKRSKLTLGCRESLASES